MLPLVLLVAVSSIAPAPGPAPLREIARVRSSAVCATLHELVLPAAAVSRDVRPLLTSLTASVRTIAGVIKDMDAQNGTGHDSAAAAFVASLTTLPAANADWEASQILAKLFDIDRLLLSSYAKYPQGRNRGVDDLRQRVQNMVDLQRAYTNALRADPAALLDNQQAQPGDPFARSLPGDPAADRTSREIVRPATGYVPGRPFAASDVRFAPASALVRASSAEERALVPAVLTAMRDCDRTDRP